MAHPHRLDKTTHNCPVMLIQNCPARLGWVAVSPALLRLWPESWCPCSACKNSGWAEERELILLAVGAEQKEAWMRAGMLSVSAAPMVCTCLWVR